MNQNILTLSQTFSSTSNRRVAAYDMARGMGIILVVAGHALTFGGYPRAIIYSFHMPLFFIISGAVMKHRDLSSYSLTKRIVRSLSLERRLFIYYYFYSACFIVFDIIVRFFALKQMDSHDLIWDAYQTLVFHGINVLWFLITLALAKAITRLVDAGIRNILYKVLFAICLFLSVSTVGNFISPRLQPVGVFQLLYYPVSALIETLSMTSFVLLGYLAHDVLPSIISKYRFALPLLLIPNVALCNLFGTVDHHLLLSGFPPLTFVLSITGTLAVMAIGEIFSTLPPLEKILGWFSRNSLFIMVTHEYFMLTSFIVIPLLVIIPVPVSMVKIFQISVILICEVPLCIWVKPWAEKAASKIGSLVDSTYSTLHKRYNTV